MRNLQVRSWQFQLESEQKWSNIVLFFLYNDISKKRVCVPYRRAQSLQRPYQQKAKIFVTSRQFHSFIRQIIHSLFDKRVSPGAW